VVRVIVTPANGNLLMPMSSCKVFDVGFSI